MLDQLSGTNSAGNSVRELHEASPAALAAFRSGLVSVVVRVCCESNFANVTDFAWLVDVLLRLVEQFPALAAAPAASKLLDLILQSGEIRAAAPGFLAHLLRCPSLTGAVALAQLRRVAALGVCGAVAVELPPSLAAQVRAHGELLRGPYGSASAELSAVTAAVFEGFWRLPADAPRFVPFCA